MKLSKYISKVLDVLIALVLLLFFASFGFRDGRTSGWYQQFFPNLNGSTITSMTFLDSLTGYAVTNPGTNIYCYILKTTNGGDNWVINYTYNSGTNIRFTKIQFADDNTGYASTNFLDFFKTTNAGLNWIQLSNPDGAEDMAVVNKDTVLVVVSDGFAGGVYRTMNGGFNWQLIWTLGTTSGNPYSIYMFNKDIGFNLGSEGMKKTTNGGLNWFVIPGETYASINFVDSLTGWKCWDSIKKTTNGGINWLAQRTPNISHNFSPYQSLSVLNKDTVWMVGAITNYTNPINPIFKTTNGGVNWGFQNADSTHFVGMYNFIFFVNKNVGWAQSQGQTFVIHTNVGGNETTFFTGIKLVENFIPSGYTLDRIIPILLTLQQIFRLS